MEIPVGELEEKRRFGRLFPTGNLVFTEIGGHKKRI
jgi:hypothetical protein